MATFVGRWTDAQLAEASVLYHGGLSLRALAERLGRSRSAMGGIANRHRDLFPPRREHLHRTLTEAKPEPKRKRAPKQKSAPMAKGIVTTVSRPTVFRTVKQEPSKDALRAMLHAAVLNTR